MFCTNCGREIIDTARFCNFCGTPIQNMAAGIPVQPVQPVQPAQPVQPVQPAYSQPVYSQPVQPDPDYPESTSIPVTENISENISGEMTETADNAENIAETEAAESTEAPVEDPVENAEAAASVSNNVPIPNTIPSYGGSETVYSAPPAYPDPAQPVNTVPVQSAVLTSENKPERRYTLGHIMMCLAAVAVMAIVAGVFAGLYFSVV